MKSRILLSSFLAASLALGASSLAFADVGSIGESASKASQASSVSTQKSPSMNLLAKKSGLVKKGKNYYFYKNGKKVKRVWKTVKGARYYFQKNGKAATGPCKIGGKYYVFNTNGKLAKGKKTRVVTIKKVKYQVTKAGRAKAGWNAKKTNYFNKNGAMFTNGIKKVGSTRYCFDSKGALIKGDGVKKIGKYDYVFLCANDKGIYDAARTGKLNAYTTYQAECTALIPLLGTPVNKYSDLGCMYINGEVAEDVTYIFKNFKVVTFRTPSNGKEFFSYLEAI